VRAAQRRGVKFGRKPSLTPEQIDHARKLIDKGDAPPVRGRPSERGPLDALPGHGIVITALVSYEADEFVKLDEQNSCKAELEDECVYFSHTR
jgi:hypothetical protein